MAVIHRVTLYNRIGPGLHPCHWCGKEVEWTRGNNGETTLVVDHLDDNRQNNEPDNLVPSCNVCNLRRSNKMMIQDGELWTMRGRAFPVRTRAIERICSHCGKTFLLGVQHANRENVGKFCSISCKDRYWHAHSGKMIREDEPFIEKVYRGKKVRQRALEMPCQGCGTVFLAPLNAVMNHGRKYCSRHCSGVAGALKTNGSRTGNPQVLDTQRT